MVGVRGSKTVWAAMPAVLVCAGFVMSAPVGAQDPAPQVDYDRDVKPIMAKCFGCHGPKQAQSGLRLDLRQNAMRGGDYGAVIVPGDAAGSKLVHRLAGSSAGMQMPPSGPLSPDEIDTIRAWIDQGAEMPGNALGHAPVAAATEPRVAAFLEAIGRQDLAAVRASLSADRTLARAADGAGSTALMHAARLGTRAIMQTLLDAGAEVNAPNARKATALHWAVPDVEKVTLLLARGADVDPKTIEGRTPLYVSAMLPDGIAVMRALVEAGADLEAQNVLGATPLFPASSTSAAHAALLLARGANPNARAKSGATPLTFTRGAEVVELLLARGADATTRSKSGETPLMEAAVRCDPAAARALLARGADVNAADHRGYTALILAAQCDRASTALVRLLLEAGADTTAVAEGTTALTHAAKRGDTEVARLLRAKNAGGEGGPVPQPLLKSAAEKGLELLVKTSPTFIAKGGCNSCHNQLLPAVAQAFAGARGIRTGEPIAQIPGEETEATAERYAEHAAPPGVGVPYVGYDLLARSLAAKPADARVHAQLHYVKHQQQPEGHWRGGAGFLAGGNLPGGSRAASARPPLNADDFTATAYMIRALRDHARPVEAEDTKARIARARAWLLATQAADTQEHAYRLLGLMWAKADRAALEQQARALEARQRPDGGWSQLATLESDAYATGMALFALAEAGVATTSPAYQAGLRYLLRTQAPDGTWHVKSRSLLFQPYFESGYPYGHDQWISAAGAAYATLAIAAAVTP